MRADSIVEQNEASAWADDALGTSDAVDVAQRIRTGDICAREAVEAAIVRAQRVNPLLNAIEIGRAHV